MIRVDNLETCYGAVEVLKKVSINVEEGEIVALLGANGAGKTTLIKSITGLVPTRSGSIRFMGRELTGMAAEDIARMGMACVPEGRRIFPGLTVLDNLLMGTIARGQFPKGELKQDLEEIFQVFPVLREFKDRLGWQLSGGQSQMLAIGRSLMARPKVMLLDEPSLGLAPVLVQEVFKVIKSINRERSTTILLVEQNARMALSVAVRGYVLATGEVVLADTTENLLANKSMQEHYLGGGKEKHLSRSATA